jgi:predicted transposase YbfD/YdcC
VHVSLWAQGKHEWLSTLLELPGGIPSHDTFGRVFSILDPDAFERCFLEWMSSAVELSQGRLVAIDGKAMRHSYERGWNKNAKTHMVSAFVKISVERCYYISTFSGTDAKLIGGHIRGHWGIENKVHWQLDISFNEDQSRVRKGNGAENYSRLNRIALNVLKREKTLKASVKGKRLYAGWNHEYLLKLMEL